MRDTTWRLLRDEPAYGAWNMALDEVIARTVGDGRFPPTLRLYAWSRPTVSLGHFQRSAGAVDQAGCHRLGVDIVRRPTGGRAVLHACELTYSAAIPLDGAWGKLSVPDSFFRLSQALVAGLQHLGVMATIADEGSKGDTPPRTGACFQVRRMPAILVSGKKLIGSAQRRWGNSLLQHGSLLLEFDVTMQQTVFPTWCDPSGDVTWLASILGGMPHRSTVEAALVAGWAEVTGASWALGGPTCEERSEAEALARGRYGNSGWTFQR